MSKGAFDRLKLEAKRIAKEPIENIETRFNPDDILEWHYVIHGPKDSPYYGGMYHGIVRFPKQYPFKPPSIMMSTPNGRFKTNTRLCLSMSDYHPETWSPLWQVSAILSGLLSFMLETTPTLGSVETSDEVKRQLAQSSQTFNAKNPQFRELFPHLVEPRASVAASAASPSAAASVASPLSVRTSPVGSPLASPRTGAAMKSAQSPASSTGDKLLIIGVIAAIGFAISYLYV